MEFRLAVGLPDSHVPMHDKKCHAAILNFLKDTQVHELIYMGDFGEYESVSHHVDSRGTKRFIDVRDFSVRDRYSLMKEYEIQNQLLDQFDKATKAKKVFLFGNHEDWVRQVMEKDFNRVVHEGKVMTIQEGLHLKERHYQVVPYNDYYKTGHLVWAHGEFHNKNAALSHVMAYQKNVVFGHIHTIQEHTLVTKTNEVMKGKSVGCLCNLNPHYQRNHANAWVHGFVVVYIFPDGNFQEQTVNIIDGRFVFNGRVYRG